MSMGDRGEVTVLPHFGQGPDTPASWTGTVNGDPQAGHWNWITWGRVDMQTGLPGSATISNLGSEAVQHPGEEVKRSLKISQNY